MSSSRQQKVPWIRGVPERNLAATESKVDWRGADLRGMSLAGVDLEGADMRACDLRGVDLSGARMRYADLRGARMQGCNCQGTDFYGAKLQGVEADHTDFRRADLRMANMGGAYLQGSLMPATEETLEMSGTDKAAIAKENLSATKEQSRGRER